MIGNHNPNGRPRVACEIGTDRVIAARVNSRQSGLEVYSTRRLPAGTIIPSLSSENIFQGEALRQAIGGALEAISGSARDVIAILPDAAARVLLLDFDDLPQKHQDAAAVVRFRAKKSLPFDSDTAALSFHVDRSTKPVKVVAAFSPMNVIAEYEAAFADCGFAPGVVIPSIIATLGVVEAERATIIVKVDGTTTSLAIVHGNSLHLLRTLENPGRSSLSAQDIASNVLPSMIFFEDTYSARIEKLFLAGLSDVDSLRTALATETKVTVEDLPVGGNITGESLGDSLPPSMLAGVAGALLG